MPVFLLDASIYIFQAHFSPYVTCKDSDGENLSALYGYARFLMQFLRRERPELMAVAMDESLFCGFRHHLCANYKSNRSLPDANLARQLDACAEFGTLLGLRVYGSQRFEADDIIGTLSSRVRHSDFKHHGQCIVSRDKDLAQLLDGPAELLWDYQANRKRNAEQVRTELGLHPHQIPDLFGLIGDAVDMISGVPGIGPVKGKALLSRFGRLETIYENLEAVTELPVRGAARMAELLRQHRDQAFLSRTLATIVTDIDDESEACSRDPLDLLCRRPPSLPELGDFLERQKFRAPEFKRILSMADGICKTMGSA